jgi:hypothetical protein
VLADAYIHRPGENGKVGKEFIAKCTPARYGGRIPQVK